MLSELCVRRPVFATMLVMSLVVLGIFSFRDLGVDLFPKADPAQVNVQLRLPGASPDEMTSSVIMPMENALSGIAGIDQMTANVNAGGNANIQIRFVLEADLEDAANAVREKVAGAMRTVPPETLPPVVQKQDPDADPIMSIMLSSKTASLRTLTEIADKQVKRALEAVNGVGAVTMNGDRSREVHIVVDVEKLNAHGLSIDQVVNAIRQENVEIPGGTLEQGKWEVGLRTLGRIEATDQFNKVIVATVNGVPLRISDIGYAEDSVRKFLRRCSWLTAVPVSSWISAAPQARTRSRSSKASRRSSRPFVRRCRPTSHSRFQRTTRDSSTRRSLRSKSI